MSNVLFDFVDKVYVINVLSREDRRNGMLNMFNEMGLNKYLENNKIDFIKAIPLPGFSDNVLKEFGVFYDYQKDKFKYGLAMCTFEHYRVLKCSQYFGFDNILVLEDDIRFHKNEKLFEKAINTIPNNYDILHLEGFYWPDGNDNYEELLSYVSDNEQESQWVSSSKMRLFDTGALIYSKKGIDKFVKLQEKDFNFADYHTFLETDDSYFYSIPLARQVSDWSDITNTYIDKNLNTNNVYERKTNIEEYYG